jgi:hypothetical protein
MNGSSNTSMRGKAAGGVAGQRPDDIDHAVLGLVVQLHRRAAELHGGVGLELDATARLGLDLLHPGLVHVEPHIGLRRHEGVELQRHRLLGQRGQGQARRARRRRRRISAGCDVESWLSPKKTMVANLTHLAKGATTGNALRGTPRTRTSQPQADAGKQQQQQGAHGVADQEGHHALVALGMGTSLAMPLTT